MLTKWNRK